MYDDLKLLDVLVGGPCGVQVDGGFTYGFTYGVVCF